MQHHLNRHIETATGLLRDYDGTSPFHLYLKKYFSQNKKHGSKDRRAIAAFCYGWFRLGRNLPDLETAERFKVAAFVTGDGPGEKAPDFFLDAWLERLSKSSSLDAEAALAERFSVMQAFYPDLDPDLLFPFKEELSEGIELQQWQYSMLRQPDLFLRLRPETGIRAGAGVSAGVANEVIHTLDKEGISYEVHDSHCLSFANSTQLAGVLALDKQAVIQDISSQRTGELLEIVRTSLPGQEPIKVWDCCAASGGKSILAKDILGQIQLTVSDIRSSILNNLRKRLATAGIHSYKALQLDLTSPVNLKEKFDLILLDAPCSGSGTWSRTPEQLIYFKEAEVNKYHELQCQIIQHVIPHLAAGGFFLYITCSVFEKENESVVRFIEQHYHLRSLCRQVIKGYAHHGDSMFAALFSMPK